MFTDPISDLLTRLRNASHARRKTLTARSSRLLKSILGVMKTKNFIADFEELETETHGKELKITLRTDREALELRRISKPGQRIYIAADKVRRVRNGFGIGIISTSKGILCDRDAKEQKVGGEYLCEVY